MLFEGRDKSLVTPEELGEFLLDAEWLRQFSNYVRLGFHKELGLTRGQYFSSLPKFKPLDKGLEERYLPVLAETRISPKRQAELARIRCYFDIDDWDVKPEGNESSSSPYITWMRLGSGPLDKAVTSISNDERGATIQDGIALWISNRPDYTQGYALLGAIRDDRVPIISQGYNYKAMLEFKRGGALSVNPPDPSLIPLINEYTRDEIFVASVGGFNGNRIPVTCLRS